MLSRWTMLVAACLLAGCSGDSGAGDSRPASAGSAEQTGAKTGAGSAQVAAATQPSRADLNKLGRAFGGGDSAHAALPPGHPPIDGAAAPRPAPAPPPTSGRPLRFDAPDGWQSQTVSSSMRKAQFVLPRATEGGEDGDMILFYFGAGQGGSVADNLERWRGMFKGADGKPVPADAATSERFDANGLKVTTLEVSGQFAPAAMPGMAQPSGPRDDFCMLAAVVETPDGPWFFRGVGPSATMREHRDRFLGMLRSVRIGE